jgi:hypothetical protein
MFSDHIINSHYIELNGWVIINLNEHERAWSWPNLGHYHKFCLEEMRENNEKL